MESPKCPKCGSGMILRPGKWGQFWGCRNFPRCKGTTKAQNAQKQAPKPRSTKKRVVVGSTEQEAIWTEITNGDTHVCANALAGTGKSFTCREAMHRIQNRRLLYVAFSKAIVMEFSGDAPDNAVVATLNSVGFRIVKSNFKNVVLDSDKVQNIIDEIWQPHTEMEASIKRTVINATEKLVALCQGYLVEPDTATLLEISDRHDVELSSDIQDIVFGLVPKVLEIDKARTGVISFNDQLWLPVVLNLSCPKYDVIFVDEAQDLNACQHQLVLRLLAPNGRAIIVGDTNQAIFGFRGSDVDSIPNLIRLLEENTNKPVKQFPLTVTRRCAKNIVTVAQSYVPQIKALETAIEGNIVEVDIGKMQFEPNDMVVCRCNAPLTSIAYSLIKKGMKAIIRGRDIGKGLLNLIDRLRPKGINDLYEKLQAWANKEIEKVRGTRREDAITQRVQDQAGCISALAENCDNITELQGLITSIFEDFDNAGKPKGAVILSSIHRAKGLEADRVIWAYPEIVIKTTQEWQGIQERNLKYVASTRAKKELIFAHESR
jgi:DNA helicase II / ATP-dependent DNA helicase PcrA